MSADQPVLEYLASTGWFASHGEVALTGGLAFCLHKDLGAADALLSFLRDRLPEVDLAPPDRWRAEVSHDDRSRIDVAGSVEVNGHSAPVIYVEAKIAAILGPNQISTYVEHQQRALALAGVWSGVLIVVVPPGRVHSVAKAVGVDLGSLGAEVLENHWLARAESTVAVTVVSWDQVFETALVGAKSAADDLRQLLGACRALRGAGVPALTIEDLEGAWQGRREDLMQIIDRVTRMATVELSTKLLPWRTSPIGGEGLAGGHRYLAEEGRPNLCVTMRSDGASPPIWVRWHRGTPEFSLVENRLRRAGYVPRNERGNLWFPLDIEPTDGPSEQQVEILANQVVRLFKAATTPVERGLS